MARVGSSWRSHHKVVNISSHFSCNGFVNVRVQLICSWGRNLFDVLRVIFRTAAQLDADVARSYFLLQWIAYWDTSVSLTGSISAILTENSGSFDVESLSSTNVGEG